MEVVGQATSSPVLVVHRPLLPRGSLRDQLHQARPLEPAALKYGVDGLELEPATQTYHGVTNLPPHALCTYARQAPARALPLTHHTPRRRPCACTRASGGSPRAPTVRPSELLIPPPAPLIRTPQLLEAMAFLTAAGLPCVHVHAGNVLLEQTNHGLGTACRISELEMALVLAPAYCDGKKLARPQLAPGASYYTVPREVVVWGYVVYELLTCRELTQSALGDWADAVSRGGETLPGPPLLWQLLRSIFLPVTAATP